ncbi:hypothetical protein B2J93_9037 [Marssonina coronariae]|uniref:Uncharacterized protein n=1 Tax=Diplocarpon coronariae TaxID=2795749 RepID=A0A218ZJS7_9HELO|nr:hypothetical protein B2J93_9037 [Marssonina coronariae]
MPEEPQEVEDLSLLTPASLAPTEQETQDSITLAQKTALSASCLSSVPAQTSQAAIAAKKERKETLKDLLQPVATPERAALVGWIDKLLGDFKRVHEDLEE